jgi:integrase/recombinase XerD
VTTPKEYLSSLQDDYINTLIKKGRSRTTVDGYRWLIRKMSARLEEAGLDPNPKNWDETTVLWLKKVGLAHLRPGIDRREMAVLNMYAQHHGNAIIKDMELEWPEDKRTHVDWLTPSQAMEVLDAAEGLERIVIHLELEMGLRRVEVIRQKVKNILMGVMHVQGKGKQGGKWRTISFHPNTIAELNRYMLIREAEISKARAKNPNVEVPEGLLIYEMSGELHVYKRSAIDKIVRRVSERVGFKFTNHTLRRTYGRMLWLAGVPIETIAEILGHADTKTTILYLGLNMDDQASAMSKLAEFQSTIRSPQNYRKSGLARQKSGQSGI